MPKPKKKKVAEKKSAKRMYIGRCHECYKIYTWQKGRLGISADIGNARCPIPSCGGHIFRTKRRQDPIPTTREALGLPA